MRSDVDLVLGLALDLLDRRLPAGPPGPDPDRNHDRDLDLDPERFAAAGFAAGLTAAIGAWAEATDTRLPEAWSPVLQRERAAVAARAARFDAVLGPLLAALDAAGVPTVPVKGAALARGLWPDGDARTMADVDLVVPPERRNDAAAALTRAGYPALSRNDWEDVHEAWPGRRPWPTDGESPDHPGKIELHPGWVERLHDYLVGDRCVVIGRARPGLLSGAPCLCLDPAGLAAQVIGHLSASVVRADVRAVQVVDAVIALRRLDGAGRDALHDVWSRLDPRLVAPGLWLVASHRPHDVPPAALASALDRLGPAARVRLAITDPDHVLRRPGSRTDLRWRTAFARTPRERAHVVRQLVLPAASDRAGDEAGVRAHARRAARAARRALQA